MSATEGEGTTVRYSVKELFARIDAKLDGLAAVLDAKADHASLSALEMRVDHLDKANDERVGSSNAQRAIVAILLAIAAMLIPIVAHVLGL
jgi:hypothetical protein